MASSPTRLPDVIRFRRGRRERAAGTDARSRLTRVGLAVAAMTMFTLILPVWGMVGAVVAAQSLLAENMPTGSDLTAYRAPSTIQIFDRNGIQLAELNDLRYGRHISIPLAEVSPWLVQATIATEDPTFATNSGISVQGILRAFVNNAISDDGNIQGGSSITQQLVKNVMIPEEERTQRSMDRKLREVILALEITRRYSKDQLLEMYLNDIYYGNLAYGIEAASLNYFDKPAKDLTLAEASLLAGLPQAPGSYNPLLSLDLAKDRQRQVLDMMLRDGHITTEQAEQAHKAELRFKRDTVPFEAQHFVLYVRDRLAERFGERGLHQQSIRVITTLDLKEQRKAQELVVNHISRVGRGLGASNGAMVALDPHTGEVRVMVGSVDFDNAKIKGQVNMATSPRQPGSSIKPYVYLSAFLKGWTPASIVLDAPLGARDGISGWNPKNATGTSYGPMPTREALANSLNLPSARTILFAGVEHTISTIHKMGINSLDLGAQFYGPPLALGTGEISLLDHVYGFSVLDNLGVMRGESRPIDRIQPGYRELDPIVVLRVEDTASGEILYQPDRQERQIVEPKYGYFLVSILTDNNARSRVFGLNNGLHLKDRLIAGKTGTTENNKDTWAMGFSPDIVVGVWAGNADNRRMATAAFGENTAAPPWLAFLKWWHEGKPATSWERPPEVKDSELYPNGRVRDHLVLAQQAYQAAEAARKASAVLGQPDVPDKPVPPAPQREAALPAPPAAAPRRPAAQPAPLRPAPKPAPKPKPRPQATPKPAPKPQAAPPRKPVPPVRTQPQPARPQRPAPKP